MADDSLPDIRARNRPGTPIAAMMPMSATTISSSISVKPLFRDTRMTVCLNCKIAAVPKCAKSGRDAQQADCASDSFCHFLPSGVTLYSALLGASHHGSNCCTAAYRGHYHFCAERQPGCAET